jgi:hypothetical protein
MCALYPWPIPEMGLKAEMINISQGAHEIKLSYEKCCFVAEVLSGDTAKRTLLFHRLCCITSAN